MKNSKKLIFLTGTRADFGKMLPLIEVSKAKGFDVTIVVTGMHMLEKYGLTKHEVYQTSGVKIHEIVNCRDGDAQDLIIANTIKELSKYFLIAKPDMVVTHGDRAEALACSIVCATNNLRCAHVEGGEVSGTIDESFRHCVSKLSFCHFTSSEEATQRLLSLGENKELIFTIGSPELDLHALNADVSISSVRDHYNIPFEEYGICIFHTVTSEVDTIGEQAQALFDSLKRSLRNFVVIMPNNDPGSEKIEEVIRQLPKAQFRILPSMRFFHFSVLMKNSACVIGNSSIGVREAPFLGLPSLNIGTRQNNRANTSSIVDCDATDRGKIKDFLEKNWGQRLAKSSNFGTGNAAAKFIENICQETIWLQNLQKSFRDNR